MKACVMPHEGGVGFDLPEHWVDLTRQGRLGLVKMRERAETVSGELRVLTG